LERVSKPFFAATETNMMRPAFAVLLAGLALVSVPLGSSAQNQDQAQPQAASPSAPGETGRYTFHRMGDTFVRLDSVTGQVAQCAQAPTGWSCAAAPDERTALESEIARLQRENATLKKTLLARGGDLPGAMSEARPVPPGNVPDPSPGIAKPPGDLKLPSDAEVDRAIAYMKNVWRKLVDMMMDLQRDIQQRKG
jgi:hypothetical protein